MKIDEVKDHYGEERVSLRGSYSSSLPGSQRIRIDGIERTRIGRRYNWQTGKYTDMQGRRVRVTALDQETGEPRKFSGKVESHLIEAKQIGDPWADHWKRTRAERERRDRVVNARDRLSRLLGDDIGISARWGAILLQVDAAEKLLDMLEPTGADEEG